MTTTNPAAATRRDTDPPDILDAVVRLGALALAFGRVERTTYHEDGTTRETDTDHTVMLGLLACALAETLYPGRLDLGRVAQYALVHDLPEAYCGDTSTLVITPRQLAAKQAREAAAAARITTEFGDALPWVPDTLAAYEAQADPEARFVRALDKTLPTITNLLNDCRWPREQGLTFYDLADSHERHAAAVAEYAGDFPRLLDLRRDLTDLVLDLYARRRLWRPLGPFIGATVRLAGLSLELGRVNRITFHEDGVTPESNTDHTVMLGLVACALAPHVDTGLDVGLVAEFAFVHDVVEVYAGDTPAIRALDADGRVEKERRELVALGRLTLEFKWLPWLPETIARYEAQCLPEARFVRALDKAMPKITHLLNGCRTPIAQGLTRDDLVREHRAQLDVVAGYAHDLPGVLAVLDGLMRRSEDAYPADPAAQNGA